MGVGAEEAGKSATTNQLACVQVREDTGVKTMESIVSQSMLAVEQQQQTTQTQHKSAYLTKDISSLQSADPALRGAGVAGGGW